MNDDELNNIYSKFQHLVCSTATLESKKTHELRDVLFEVTQACNMRCEHCCISAEAMPPVEEIEGKYFKKVLDELASVYNPNTIGIGFTGGEPLMRKDIFEIAEYAHNLGFPMSLTTNGTLLTDKVIEKLHNMNVLAICISIDGLEKTHEEFRKLPGCYPRLLKSMRKIKEYKDMQLGITTVVNKKNINELEGLYKQFCDIGVDYWRVIGLDPIGRAQENNNLNLEKEDFENMFDFIEEKNKERKMYLSYTCSHFLGFDRERRVRVNYCYKCSTGIHVAYILSNGDIFGCSNIPRRPELVQGNVKTDNFVDVWENKFQIYRDPNIRKNAKCAKCEYWRYCLGDAMHTYDFDNNRPLVCMKDILKF